MKHTEGSWFIYTIEGQTGYGIVNGHEVNVTEGVPIPNLADANLIAAAPELLETLELIIEVASKKPTYQIPTLAAAIQFGHFAIKKAKGETK